MKKRTTLLILNLFILFTLFSCRNESLISEDIRLKQEIISKQLSFDELRNVPSLTNKISSFRNNRNLKVYSKTYTDSINNFSIDTEYGLYLEDNYGNKTYTFKIERNPPSSSFENLVLKDIGNGEFQAYITKYDSILLNNPSNFSPNLFQISYIGNKSSSILEKLTTCSVTVTSQVYVPGICSGEGHQTGDSSCLCGTPGHNCTPADEGYYTTVYSTYYYTCDDGSGSSGGSGVPTSPYPPGGGGGTITSPCNKIKNANTKFPSLKPALVNLSSTTTQNHENGFFIDQSATTSTPNPVQNVPPGTGGVLNINTNPPHKYVIFAHTHDAVGPDGQGTYSIFSWDDLAIINSLIKNNHIDVSDFIFYVITADGTKYAITISDPSVLDYFFYNPENIVGQPYDIERAMKMQKFFEIYYDKSKGGLITETSNPANDKVNFLKFLKETGLNSSISLFEVDPTFTTYTQLSLSSNGTVNPKNCN